MDPPSCPAPRDPIALSALNHYLYCARRAYLIHAEGVFVDNEHTLLGDLAHEAVDLPGFEHRAGCELLRALPLFSDRLGLTGKADLVEVRRDTASGRITEARPIEYKKGPKRRFENDEVQLCAQALCLEEMLGVAVPTGAIFHAASARRRDVIFDSTLRTQTTLALAALRSLLVSPTAPSPELKPQCDGCSLREVCVPELTLHRTGSLFTPRTYV